MTSKTFSVQGATHLAILFQLAKLVALGAQLRLVHLREIRAGVRTRHALRRPGAA